MFVRMLTHSHLRWYTCGVGTFAKGLQNWLINVVCGGSWIAILLDPKCFGSRILGIDSPMNELSIESRSPILDIRAKSQSRFTKSRLC
jgi:hypothetical protein